MEFRQLQAFVMVANTGSFSQAAKMLGYAQSSITTQIKLLEEELTVRLFDRLGRKVVLTDQGQCFLRYTQQLLALAAEAKAMVADAPQLSGTLTIGAPESLCATYLPQVLKHYRQQHPGVNLVVKIGSYRDFLEWLNYNTIDLAFFFQRTIVQPQLTTQYLRAEDIIAVAAPGQPLPVDRPLSLGDLQTVPVILAEAGCSYRTILEGMLSQADVYLENVLELGSLAAIKQCTVSGLGITFLPRIAVEEELKSGQLVDLQWGGPAFGTVIQMAYHKDKWLSPALKAFLTVSEERMGIQTKGDNQTFAQDIDLA